MPNAAQLRSQLESALSTRVPGAFTVRPKAEVRRMACGFEPLDTLLQGGLAVGALTEIVGAECSGKTSTALAYVAAGTRAGKVCAWIDAADALDPESAAANGVNLERLLWVRCGTVAQEVKPTPESTVPGVPPEAPLQSPPVRSCGTHPRSEATGMSEAVGALLTGTTVQSAGPGAIRRRNKSIGTPGAPNRPLSGASVNREEQVNSDRLPPRRGDNLTIASVMERPLTRPAPIGAARETDAAKRTTNHYAALDQALRALDLLIQGGGFSVVVLDLGSTPAAAAWRIPAATWFRFRTACERTRVSLLLLTQTPCARSSADSVVRLGAGTPESEGRVMTGVQFNAFAESSRRAGRVIPIRKPPQPDGAGREARTGWSSPAMWVAGR